ncbi:MAG: M48 family metallopeptidase [Terracidiphilus sp.]
MLFFKRLLPALCLALLFSASRLHASSGPLAPSHTAAPAAASPSSAAVLPAYTLPPGKLAKAIALGRIRTALDIGGALWGLAVLWLLLSTGLAAGLDRWAGGQLRRRWQQGLLFFAALVAIVFLAGLPVEAAGHLASRHYGISVQGWAGWCLDQAKALGLSLVFGAPLLLLFNWIVRVSPRRYWLWAWLVSLPLLAASVFTAPLLDPVFNQFEPLEAHHPALVRRLESLVARTGIQIPPSRMFLMKASRKSNGINAYVTGIGATKRLVLWDTTIERLPPDEILFIFGHESGHYVLHHIPKELAGTAAALFFVFWACAAISGRLALRFAARWRLVEPEAGSNPPGSSPGIGVEPPAAAALLASRSGFLVLLLALSTAGFLLQPASNAFSRYFEHQADIYGQEAIHGLVPNPQTTAVSAFDHLGEAWLEDPNPSPIVEFWEFSHPSVQQRVRFAAHYDPWANGGHGKYFRK